MKSIYGVTFEDLQQFMLENTEKKVSCFSGF